MDEVKKIVVVRGMRATLSFQIGFAFFALVANFRKRHEHTAMLLGEEDFLAPQFDTFQTEEAAIRKDLRELFANSVKGLDFLDLVQDRETFDRMYQATYAQKPLSPEASIRLVEQFVDDLLYCEEMCEMLHVKFICPQQRGKKTVNDRKRTSIDIEGLGRQTRGPSRSFSMHNDAGEGGSRARLESLDLGHVTARRISITATDPPLLASRRTSVTDATAIGTKSRMSMVKEEDEHHHQVKLGTRGDFTVLAGVGSVVLVCLIWGWRRALVAAIFATIAVVILLLPKKPKAD